MLIPRLQSQFRLKMLQGTLEHFGHFRVYSWDFSANIKCSWRLFILFELYPIHSSRMKHSVLFVNSCSTLNGFLQQGRLLLLEYLLFRRRKRMMNSIGSVSTPSRNFIPLMSGNHRLKLGQYAIFSRLYCISVYTYTSRQISSYGLFSNVYSLQVRHLSLLVVSSYISSTMWTNSSHRSTKSNDSHFLQRTGQNILRQSIAFEQQLPLMFLILLSVYRSLYQFILLFWLFQKATARLFRSLQPRSSFLSSISFLLFYFSLYFGLMMSSSAFAWRLFVSKQALPQANGNFVMILFTFPKKTAFLKMFSAVNSESQQIHLTLD